MIIGTYAKYCKVALRAHDIHSISRKTAKELDFALESNAVSNGMVFMCVRPLKRIMWAIKQTSKHIDLTIYVGIMHFLAISWYLRQEKGCKSINGYIRRREHKR